MSRITDDAIRGAGQAIWTIFIVWAAMLAGLVYGIYWFIHHINSMHH